MRIIILLSFLVLTYAKATAQQIKRLTIGDELPELTFRNVLNYKSKTLKTSDLQGKLIILDFWNVNCKACIASMPKMEKLQEHFSDKIQVIYVTTDSRGKVSDLAKKIKIVRENNLPSIIGDTVLSSYFYFQTVPTHVWINEARKIIHITEGWDTNESTVSAYLNGENPVIAEKFEKEQLKGKNALDFFGENSYASKIAQYSFFMSKLEGARSSFSINKDSSGKGFTDITFINSFPLNMFQYAFSEIPLDFSDLRRVVLKGKKSTNFLGPTEDTKKSQWRDSQMTCYQLKVPESLSPNALEFMKEDLTRYFSVDVSVKKQKVKCLALVCKSDPAGLYSKGGDTICSLMRNKFVSKNSPISGLVYWLNNFSANKFQIPIFIDSTNIHQNIDLELDENILIDFNVESLRKCLEAYGLTLVEREEFIDVLVISDK